jgi:hypothetical protein
MEPVGSLPSSQEPAVCLFPEPDQSSLFFPIPLLKDIRILKVESKLRDSYDMNINLLRITG